MISSSPDPLKLLSKLNRETRNKVVDFAVGGDHIADEDYDAKENESTTEEGFCLTQKSQLSLAEDPGVFQLLLVQIDC